MFAFPQVCFFGHLLASKGIQADPEKISDTVNIKSPKNFTQLMTCIQTSTWFRRFSGVARPLTCLMKKHAIWKWESEQQSFFETLESALTSTPIFRQADKKLPFVILTDANNYALGAFGAVLLQGEENDERRVEYASHLLTPTYYTPCKFSYY